MDNKLWFRAKRYGWGWYPVSWQGWATVLVFVALAVWNGLDFSSATSNATLLRGQPTDAVLFWFFAKLIVLVAALIFICYKKGEEPRWRWDLPVGEGKDDWRYCDTPVMRKIRVALLVMIIVGLLLLATQKLWVGSVVDFILKNNY
jgi:hypothetical protein